MSKNAEQSCENVVNKIFFMEKDLDIVKKYTLLDLSSKRGRIITN